MAVTPLLDSESAVAGADGIATVHIGPFRAFERWNVTSLSVQSTSSNSIPEAHVYRAGVAPSNLIAGTSTGNLDTAVGAHAMHAGEMLVVQWTGCDVGASCTVVVEGERAISNASIQWDSSGLQFGNPIVAGEVLSRNAIESPNYVPGVSGWAINRDGTAEFRNVIVQGSIVLTPGQVTNVEISDVAVNKVTAGTTQFDWTLGARIKTADTGTRVELSANGLQAFNGSVQTVDISAITGDVSILGQLLSGNSGLRVVVNPTGATTPQIRWYPNSGVNYSQIHSSGTLFTGEATMVMTSGINAGNTASARFLIAAGFMGGEILDETGLLDNGGSWDIAESYVAMRYTDIAGTGGALFYGNSTRTLVGMVSDHSTQASKGGMLRVENTFNRLRMESASNTNNGGFIYQDGSVGQYGRQIGSDATYFEMISSRFTDHYGRWHDFQDNGSNQGIFGATISYASATSASWSYGTTKQGEMVPIAVIFDGVVHQYTIDAISSSSGSMIISPAGAGSWAVMMWAFQI